MSLQEHWMSDERSFLSQISSLPKLEVFDALKNKNSWKDLTVEYALITLLISADQ